MWLEFLYALFISLHASNRIRIIWFSRNFAVVWWCSSQLAWCRINATRISLMADDIIYVWCHWPQENRELKCDSCPAHCKFSNALTSLELHKIPVTATRHFRNKCSRQRTQATTIESSPMYRLVDLRPEKKNSGSEFDIGSICYC